MATIEAIFNHLALPPRLPGRQDSVDKIGAALVRIIGEQKVPILDGFLSKDDKDMHASYCLITYETLSQLPFPSQRRNANASII
jgi:hypothetical protein